MWSLYMKEYHCIPDEVRNAETETVNKTFLSCGYYTIEVAIRQPALGLLGPTSTKKNIPADKHRERQKWGKR